MPPIDVNGAIADKIEEGICAMQRNPPAAALCAPGTALNVISYARLERFINNIGRRALTTGIRPGDIVAIMVKDYIFHAAIALALARVGWSINTRI